MSHSPAYSALKERWQRMYHYRHLLAIASVDRNTLMPPGGSESRSQAMAALEMEVHRLGTEAHLRDQIAAARQESLDEVEIANLREIEREWFAANALPASLVERRSLATARCEHAWRSQRPANDWVGFLENFRPVVNIAREEAQLLSMQTGLAPYDALMDRFEPGMRAEQVGRCFADLDSWLPDLIQKVVARQASQAPPVMPQGPFRREAQRALGPELMGLLGFDLTRGRLDESTHPFCGGVPEDVRITTRYRDDDAINCVMGVIHETGHARYEQNLPRLWLGQPIANARSMAIHESQSLAFEMQLARSQAFITLLAPLLARHHGPQPAFAEDNLGRLVRRVNPGLIRVDADELTYPLHIVLRFRIERDLIEGRIEAEDIPGLWDQAMRDSLGLDTRGDFRNGCLQDVHWPEGLFGYFPCYTLGAMYAAQWFATIRKDVPDLDTHVTCGRLTPVFEWLNRNIWSQGSRWETAELCLRASGSALDPAHFRTHLESRYLG